MYETFKMRNGKLVNFYSRLVFRGIIVEVSTLLIEAEKKIFEREIRSERDVIQIIYLKK